MSLNSCWFSGARRNFGISVSLRTSPAETTSPGQKGRAEPVEGKNENTTKQSATECNPAADLSEYYHLRWDFLLSNLNRSGLQACPGIT